MLIKIQKSLLSLLFLILLFSCTPNQDTIFKDIENLQKAGAFSEAEKRIDNYLDDDPHLDIITKEKLLFERERGKRIINDYRLTEDKLATYLSRKITDFSKDEFIKWQQEGRFDILMVNGEKRFANPSVSNLLFRYPELKNRIESYDKTSQQARLSYAQAQKLKVMSNDFPDPIKLPRHCKVSQSLTIKEGKVPDGKIINCWLPYPSIFETQGNIQFISSSFPPIWIADPTSRIRSIYFEAVTSKNNPLEFELEYYYTAYAYYQEIDPDRVEQFNENEMIYREYTREEYPHEVFTPEMRQLANDIIGSENNPYLKGKKIYSWIADNIKYSYAREYSTLRNISQYCYENKYGDCGQEAILFITLCRIAGVPARWQSGFMTFPDDEGMHDWTEIYIKPYGWLPVDPYMGIFFTSMTEDLTSEQRKEMRDFYYGNIDHYRLVANKGHNQDLYPIKKHFRSETVDFQRGEVEWAQGNLYFTDWGWGIWVEDVTGKPKSVAFSN